MNLNTFCLIRSIFKSENPNINLCMDIYGQISFKLSLAVETTNLYILIPSWRTLTSIHGHSCMGNEKLSVFTVFGILSSVLLKFSVLPQPVGLWKLKLN